MKKLLYFVSLLLLLLPKDAFASSDTGFALPDAFMVIPFVVLLLMIATGPLFYHHFWEKHYPKIAIFLGLITVFYYLTVLGDTHSLTHTLAEYLSFIALLASLFVASGGILIKVDRKSTPMLNVVILHWIRHCQYYRHNRGLNAIN